MPICWASSLGGCSSRQSGEHSISRNLLEGDVVHIRGFPWCRDAEAALPPQALTQNILCTQHNSDLSETDEAGGSLFRAFSALKREAARRLRTGKKSKLLRVYRVNGNLTERWLLKTVINTGIGMTRHSWWPSDSWVRKAFGASDFPPPEGMYLVPGGDVYDGMRYRFAIDLLADGERPIGGLFDLDGLSFAVCAEPYEPRRGWQRRPRAIAEGSTYARHQKIIFDWNSG